jgi:uncharacterized protein YdeI (BOF family)
MKLMKYTLSVLAISALMASPAMAGTNPYAKANGTWITLGGTVKSVTRDAFELNYGNGMITVEMDDGDRDADAYKLLPGDEVTVTGMIDDDFFETTKIEASSVYVKKLGTSFYASPVDEEDFYYTSYYMVEPAMMISGTVTSVSDHEFTVDTAARKLTVDVQQMPYNPLDDEGYQKIRKGDRVSVTGEIDYDLFEGRELVANSVVVLKKAKSSGAASMSSNK